MADYEKMVDAAKAVKTMMEQTGKQPKDLTNANLRLLLLPLKQNDKMPTLKKKMLECYEQWKHRPYLQVDMDVVPDEVAVEAEEDNIDVTEITQK